MKPLVLLIALLSGLATGTSLRSLQSTPRETQDKTSKSEEKRDKKAERKAREEVAGKLLLNLVDRFGDRFVCRLPDGRTAAYDSLWKAIVSGRRDVAIIIFDAKSADKSKIFVFDINGRFVNGGTGTLGMGSLKTEKWSFGFISHSAPEDEAFATIQLFRDLSPKDVDSSYNKHPASR